MEFSRREYWSGWPFPSPGDLPDPGIEHRSPALQADALPSEPPGKQENKVYHSFHCFPIYLPWSDGTRCHDLQFLNVGFKPAFSLSSFTFIKRLFSSTSLSAIRVVSSAYLRLLIFLPTILIPACASSSPAFHMIYSAYKLNKQGDNIQPWCTSFPIWNQSLCYTYILCMYNKCKSHNDTQLSAPSVMFQMACWGTISAQCE